MLVLLSFNDFISVSLSGTRYSCYGGASVMTPIYKEPNCGATENAGLTQSFRTRSLPPTSLPTQCVTKSSQKNIVVCDLQNNWNVAQN